MIIFNGYLQGKSKKRFLEKKRKHESLLLLLAFVPFFTIWYGFFSQINKISAAVAGVSAYLFIMIMLIFVVPKIDDKKITPNKIYTDGKYITAVTVNIVETKQLDWVKQVIDYGEFYELTFPFGKMSNSFICQKDLLTQGKLKDFEALFKGKLVKK